MSAASPFRFRYLFILLALASILLNGCGGGGGGGGSSAPPADPFGDGLGTSGQAAGTTRVAAVANGANAVPVATLDDVGRALAVWLDANALSWTRRNQNGQWDPSSTLAQATSAGTPRLRGITTGDAALAWSGGGATQLLRYSPTTTWDVAATAVPLALPDIKIRSDLMLFPDGTVALSRSSAATTPSPPKNSAFHTLKHTVAGGWATVLETDPLEVSGSSFLAANANGSASLFWVEGQNGGGSITWSLHSQVLDVLAGSKFGPLSIPNSNYTPCFDFPPVSVVASQTPLRVVGIVNRDPLGTDCNFDTIRINIFTASIDPQRMNAAGTKISGPPFLVMSPAGDALAVWSEQPIGMVGPKRVMWSKSLQGGAWGPPALAIDADAIVGTFAFTLEINSAGQVAAGLKSLINNREYVSVGRFSFSTGWSTWQPVANTSAMSTPAVAINTQGQAVLVYAAAPCSRLTQPNAFQNCGAPGIYAFAF